MTVQVPPMKEHDLPKREKSFWKMTGPGAVMVGLAIGSGEMVLWPWITAKFGAGMAWAAVLGIFAERDTFVSPERSLAPAVLLHGFTGAGAAWVKADALSPPRRPG